MAQRVVLVVVVNTCREREKAGEDMRGNPCFLEGFDTNEIATGWCLDNKACE